VVSKQYIPRLVDAQVERALRSSGAVLIEGSKACGKTSTARQQAASLVRLDFDVDARRLGLNDPRSLLVGETPRLIDEWQRVPEVWNAVRNEVDDRGVDGQFILTGSATPADDETRHSGAGRIARVTMRPMSLAESGDSDRSVSLADVLDGREIASAGVGEEARHVVELACRGGWPLNLRRGLVEAMAANRDYLSAIAATDIRTIDGVKRDPRRVSALLFSLARNVATYVTRKRLASDAADYGEAVLSDPTLRDYLDALVRLWIAVPQEAWGQSLRSSAQVAESPKWHLADPSLAVAATRATPELLATTESGYWGFVFESLVFRDFSVYAQALGGEIRAFRETKSGQEIDLVYVNGPRWAGFEVKTSSLPEVVDRAATSLIRTAATLRVAQPPAALGVIVPTGYSYRRPDGVYVLNIQHLAP
jgi:predicted AAA+ superfamily ATPase